MKIYFVRHGQSLGNAKHTLLGHTDLDLSELGYKQARATAEAMREINIDAIFASDLKRAFNTAVPHGELRGIPVVGDERLRECYIGEWENQTSDWCRENYPVAFCVDWINAFGTFTFPGGESTLGGGERFLRRTLEICKENEGKDILIVSHAAVLRAFWGIISGLAPEEVGDRLAFPTNASYSVCEFDGERLIPIEYSHDEHLAEIGITKISYD